MIGNIFIQSWLIWATFHTTGEHCFHQKFPLLSSDLKNVYTKDFPMHLFANVLQIRCYCKFPDNHKKYVLESLFNPCFNKVTGLMVWNFIKKETPSQVLSCEYLKMFEKTFCGTPPVATSKNGFEEFLTISKDGLT